MAVKRRRKFAWGKFVCVRYHVIQYLFIDFLVCVEECFKILQCRLGNQQKLSVASHGDQRLGP